MLRFVSRRLLQMIPTLFGVIVVTFVLFNLVGGSPARMKLGDKASPRALEEFDEQRGYNKPLFWGRSVATRALIDADFSKSAGAWSQVKGAQWREGALVMAGDSEWDAPFAFPLRRDASYEWHLRWRTAESRAWQTSRIVMEPGADASLALREWAAGRSVELSSLTLRRRLANPWDSQFLFYLKQLARLDFGVSSSANEPVLDLLKAGIGPTLALAFPIILLETILSVSLGLWCAAFSNRWPDRLLVIGSVALMSVNYLVWIIVGQYVLAFRLGWFPVWGFTSWTYLALPVLIGAFSGLGSSVRFYRTILLDEMYREYVRTAYAKGLGRGRVLFVHVLRNALVPIITQVILSIPFLYTGSLLLESFFGIPGLGYLSVNAINESDVDVVRAVVVLGSALYLLTNLLADLCYAWADPRVRLT
ncbi:MAG: ABC transporter permease [Kiritimatiellae bacterium]|nr:ABC transporter permease [Kiritimatiellia bacterium]MCO5062211.1 ABC transporter permease [Kiritimatiellia bacterium]MCO5069017.1 ABC transporter permease [Kiritimatiellia bacterium]MCO6401596.1 ABC transporter permease [Verrucomicrobiota bacterium]